MRRLAVVADDGFVWGKKTSFAGKPVLPFSAHCQRGHDRIDFTDRELFTAHMKGEHHAKAIGRSPFTYGPIPWTPPEPRTDEEFLRVLHEWAKVRVGNKPVLVAKVPVKIVTDAA